MLNAFAEKLQTEKWFRVMKKILKEYLDLNVSKEEKREYNKYCNQVNKEAKLRVGSNICAYSFVAG